MDERHLTWSEVHLDAMRGLAALVVAFGHGRGLMFSSFSNTLAVTDNAAHVSVEPMLTIGHQAVIVFFVLSGYLVGGSVLNTIATDRWLWTHYLVKRLVRLWIVLVPAILIGILIDIAGLTLLAHEGSIYNAPVGQEYVTINNIANGYSISTILGNLLFLQGIFVPTAGTNLALWSLSNEFWYYLMFPMLVFVWSARVTVPWRIALGFTVICLVALIGAHAVFLFLVWCLGAMVAYLPKRIASQHSGTVVLLGAVVFVSVFVTLKKFGLSFYMSELVLGSLAASLIYAIKCQDSIATTSIYSQASRFFSNMSYTLYLSHLPFLIFVCALINTPWSRWAISPMTVSAFLFIMLLAIVWAWLLYTLFEAKTDPVRHMVWAGIAKLMGDRLPKAL